MSQSMLHLQSMTPDERLLAVVSEMKKRAMISAEQTDLIRKQLMNKDKNLRFVLVLLQNHSKFEDIASLVTSYLTDADKPHEEDFSPSTKQKFEEVSEDSSPLGNMLMHRKMVHQERETEKKDFKLTLQNN